MDEKIKEALKSVYNNLTDEQKEKAKACKTYEELMDFAGKEGIELPDDLTEEVTGGMDDYLAAEFKMIDGQPQYIPSQC